MSNLFYSLTPDRVIDAVEKSGFSLTGHYMVLNSFENRVYDLMQENGSGIIVKFYRPGRWSAEQILEEHRFLLDLAEDEIPVCAPLSFSDGSTIHEADGIFFAVWPKTGGRIPEELTDDELRRIGRLIARIHNNGSVKNAVSRLRLTGKTYALNSLEFLTQNNFLPSSCTARYSDAVKEIAHIYDSLAKEVPFHRIHGDCHPGNLLKRDGYFFFLDFDDFLTGPAVQDIWMLLSSRDTGNKAELDLILQGYRDFRDFNSSWLKLIEPLRGLRYIFYAAWIARRWNDPAFPSIFPHFGTQEYWEKETSDLEDQVNIIYSSIHGDENVQMPEDKVKEEKVLTNKDFFWDLE
jgi:Ser/Thr protein kinase RdoA (MazF antagonist)